MVEPSGGHYPNQKQLFNDERFEALIAYRLIIEQLLLNGLDNDHQMGPPLIE